MTTLSDMLSLFSSAAAGIKAFKEILSGRTGNARAILAELKENMGLCDLVLTQGTDPARVIQSLSSVEYDRILRTDFNFNSLRRKKINLKPSLRKSPLSHFHNRETKDLLESIYDKTKELRRLFRYERTNPSIQWRRRFLNLRREIGLLLYHLRSK